MTAFTHITGVRMILMFTFHPDIVVTVVTTRQDTVMPVIGRIPTICPVAFFADITRRCNMAGLLTSCNRPVMTGKTV